MIGQKRFNKLVQLEVRFREIQHDPDSTLSECLKAAEAVADACRDSDGQLDDALRKRVEEAADRFASHF